ncbi:ABC transporter ATP-binding protein [Bacillus sp. T33-2]|uniref:ABC transporter ATP-binding protein n=1 Tax=Bacillus sp. T33-2 TaxID=2054168 RepID=UPI000C77B49A|nr:ABC transporter ATP-binding protein [Bacillus sp. T33-2]PLR97563.1 glycine/betaine ABC transporter ATP-binding protein [Bacillus sp. T33-2]
MIQFDNVSKHYPDGSIAIKNMNLEIKKGEFFVLIGPSGCGKTTTLKMINRLIDLSNGTIFIQGKMISDYDIHELRWNIGYVLQQIALFPHMTIEENIAIVPELRKWDRRKIEERIDELLEMVGLEPDTYRGRKPAELSGGQQQRIGVIRALAADPEIILMDEPFSALDPISREKLQDDILELQRTINKTIVFVTHDMEEALKLGDRICVMKDGEVVQLGTPSDILQNPANNFVRQFIGNQKMLLDEKIDLEQMVSRMSETENILSSERALPSSASLKETLDNLKHNDLTAVEKDGEIIGTIDRQSVIHYLAERLQERGKDNG